LPIASVTFPLGQGELIPAGIEPTPQTASVLATLLALQLS
jgi:hypothetical protein